MLLFSVFQFYYFPFWGTNSFYAGELKFRWKTAVFIHITDIYKYLTQVSRVWTNFHSFSSLRHFFFCLFCFVPLPLLTLCFSPVLKRKRERMPGTTPRTRVKPIGEALCGLCCHRVAKSGNCSSHCSVPQAEWLMREPCGRGKRSCRSAQLIYQSLLCSVFQTILRTRRSD